MAAADLSKLSACWWQLGIRRERTDADHPEQNGRHQRMHRTLKAETTRPAAATFLQQQERFDRFVHEYNTERPHEASTFARRAGRTRLHHARSPRSPLSPTASRPDCASQYVWSPPHLRPSTIWRTATSPPPSLDTASVSGKSRRCLPLVFSLRRPRPSERPNQDLLPRDNP